MTLTRDGHMWFFMRNVDEVRFRYILCIEYMFGAFYAHLGILGSSILAHTPTVSHVPNTSYVYSSGILVCRICSYISGYKVSRRKGITE